MSSDDTSASAGGTNRRLGAVYALIFRRWRVRREKWFREKLGIVPGSRIIDVGGYPEIWNQPGYDGVMVDVINLDLENDTAPSISMISGAMVRSLQGDGRTLPFKDASYDIAYSNSVIEHVGSTRDQERFAQEIMRVGRSLWVQTPAPLCPIEPHFLGLAIHWLPRAWRPIAARVFSLRGLFGGHSMEHLREISDTTRLVSKKRLRSMFPGCIILTERILGVIPKSYIVVRAES